MAVIIRRTPLARLKPISELSIDEALADYARLRQEHRELLQRYASLSSEHEALKGKRIAHSGECYGGQLSKLRFAIASNPTAAYWCGAVVQMSE
jgi:hypothetical protein